MFSISLSFSGITITFNSVNDLRILAQMKYEKYYGTLPYPYQILVDMAVETLITDEDIRMTVKYL